jgi:hypothetical protein
MRYGFMASSWAQANFAFCNPDMKQRIVPKALATGWKYCRFSVEGAVWSDCSDQDYRQRAALEDALCTVV